MKHIYDIFVFCGGKCGSSTLESTFKKYNYRVLHTHSDEHFKITYETNTSIFDVINYNKINKKIYIIDSYRTPIERKISSFFQNIHKNIPFYKNLNIDQLIYNFNKSLLHLEINHPINMIFDNYKLPHFNTFDFEKKYNILKFVNVEFIKIRFSDIKNWSTILSKVFHKNIIVSNANLSNNKPYYVVYKEFLNVYKVPKEYLNTLLFDTEFKIYNTIEERIKYIRKWFIDIIEYSDTVTIDVPFNNVYKIKYGIRDNLMDITEIVKEKCIVNDHIIIPSDDNNRTSIFGDPIPYVKKSIFIEWKYIEYPDSIEIILPLHSKIFYGTRDNNIDVSEIANNTCVNGDRIIIPSGDLNRDNIFGDPYPNILKCIYVDVESIIS